MRSLVLSGLVLASLLLVPAGAAARDRDHDGLPDRWEKRHGLSLKVANAGGDPDRDRVDNRNEHREGTAPRDRDSDDDGRRDGREDADRDKLSNADEDATGNDPRDRDSDDDGVIDGREQAGVVKSFDGEELVLELSRGGSISGFVSADTRLSCESEKEAESEWGGAKRAGAASEDEEPPEDEGGEDDEADFEDGWEDEEPGEEDDGEGDWEDEKKPGDEKEDSCPLSRLKPGARVHEAELEIDAEGAWFVKIELLA